MAHTLDIKLIRTDLHLIILVEKVTVRINEAYSKHLPYAERLQIINAVLFPIYNFRGAVFILPQCIERGGQKM